MIASKSIASYPVTNPSLAELAAGILVTTPRAGITRVVAIDGPAGSGKTTLAAHIAGDIGAPTIHMDDLFPGWDGLAEAAPLLKEWVLEPLAQGNPARYRRYDWHQSGYAEWVDVPTADTLIVEGCGSGSLVVAPYLSLLIWVDAPLDVRMARGLARDGETFRPHWERWAKQEDAVFSVNRTADRADVQIDGRWPVPPRRSDS